MRDVLQTIFMVQRICTWVIDKYSFFNLKKGVRFRTPCVNANLHTYQSAELMKMCLFAYCAISQHFVSIQHTLPKVASVCYIDTKRCEIVQQALAQIFNIFWSGHFLVKTLLGFWRSYQKVYRAWVGPVGKAFQRPTFSCGTDVVYYYRCHFITVCVISNFMISQNETSVLYRTLPIIP